MPKVTGSVLAFFFHALLASLQQRCSATYAATAYLPQDFSQVVDAVRGAPRCVAHERLVDCVRCLLRYLFHVYSTFARVGATVIKNLSHILQACTDRDTGSTCSFIRSHIFGHVL